MGFWEWLAEGAGQPRRVEDALDAIEANAPAHPTRADVTRARSAINRADFPPALKRRKRERLERTGQDAEAADRAPDQIRRLAQDLPTTVTNRDDLIKRARELKARQQHRNAPTPTGWSTVTPGAENPSGAWFLPDVLDVPHKGVRQLTAPGHEVGSKPLTQKEWFDAVEKEAAKDGLSAADVLSTVAMPAGALATGALAPGLIHYRALARAAAAIQGGRFLKRDADGSIDLRATAEAVGRNLKEIGGTAVSETYSGGKEFGAAMLTDPLNYFSGGGAGTLKNVLGVAERAMARGALEESAKALVRKEIAAAVRSATTKQELVDGVRQALQGTGVDFERAFGREGRFVGEGQLAIEPPFLGSRARVELQDLPLVGDKIPEYGIRRRLAPGDPIGRPLEAVPPTLDPKKAIQRETAEDAIRLGLGAQKQSLKQYEERLLDLARTGPPSLERQRELIQRNLDPFSFEPADIDAVLEGFDRVVVPKRKGWVFDDVGDETRIVGADGVAVDTRRQTQIPGDPARTQVANVGGGTVVADMGPARAGHPRQYRLAQRPVEMTEAEAAWLDDVRLLAQDIEAHKRRTGAVSGPGARNPITGVYYTRGYASPTGHLDDVDPMKARTGPEHEGLAMGALDLTPAQWKSAQDLAKREFPEMHPRDVMGARSAPEEMLPLGAASAAKSEGVLTASKKIEDLYGSTDPRWSGDPRWKEMREGSGVFVPREVAEIVNGSFDQSLDSFSRFLKKELVDGKMTGKSRQAALAVLESGAFLRDNFKGIVLLTRPAYIGLMVRDDLIQMALGGMKDPRRLLEGQDALRAMDSGMGYVIDTPMGRLDAAREMRRYSIAQNGTGKLDLNNLESFGIRQKMGQIRRKKAKAEGVEIPLKERAAAAAQTAAAAPKEVGARMAAAWEDRAKAAFFIDRLKKGDSPAAAAKAVSTMLIDYHQRSRGLSLLRWLLPFASWAAKAPRMALSALKQSPGRVAGVERAFQAEGDDPRWEAPRHMTELSNVRTFRPGERRFESDLSEALGYGPIPGGYDIMSRTRGPVPEATRPAEELARGNTKPVTQMLAPELKGAVEAVTEVDAYSGRPLDLAAQGYGSKALGALLRYGAPLVVPPIAGRLFSENMYYGGGGERGGMPLNTVGYMRPYADDDNVANYFALRNMFFPEPAYAVSPESAVQSEVWSPKAKALRDALQKAAAGQSRIDKLR